MSAPSALRLRSPAHRVAPRATWIWFLHGVGSAVFFTAAAGIGVTSTAFSPPWWAWLIWAGAWLVYVIVMPIYRYQVHRWEATPTAFYTQTGWLTRERRIAPMSRVQTVDVKQGVLARLLRLATLTITTASAAGPLEVSGLDVAVAHRLSEQLSEQAMTLAGDAT